MAPHDSAAKNKGEYDSCVACYFRDDDERDDAYGGRRGRGCRRRRSRRGVR